jgi:hypothetical protein
VSAVFTTFRLGVPVGTAGGGGTGVTGPSTELSLFDLSGSGSGPSTLALLRSVPVALAATSTVIDTCAEPPEASGPSSQVTAWPLAEQVPRLGAADLKVVPTGSVSLTVTLLDAEGPWLVIASV